MHWATFWAIIHKRIWSPCRQLFSALETCGRRGGRREKKFFFSFRVDLPNFVTIRFSAKKVFVVVLRQLSIKI
jgi:hypothetical protein